MGHEYDLSQIEKIAERLGLISNRSTDTIKQQQGHSDEVTPTGDGDLASYPDPEAWDDWTEYESSGEPRDYSLVPTACFNCEAGCGLLTYIDKETGEIRKIEGNPEHPGSRGRNCAKGPATINQLNDPQRIEYPLKRDGPRGSGQWTRVSWDEALGDIASEMREAIEDDRGNEITYHVGRPGHEDYMDRVIDAWGVDGHHSHTNICSAGARAGYALWRGGSLGRSGSNLCQAFGAVPPSVPTLPVSTDRKWSVRETCHPPLLPEAAERQIWLAY